jgi:hypothetical protein
MQSDSAATVKTDAHSPLKSAPINWLELIGPISSIDSLPPPDTKRWVIRRKAEVVAAVRAGILSLEEACRRYTLSIEEFLSWQRLVESHGLPGLRVTRLQDYREIGRDRSPQIAANFCRDLSKLPCN